MTIKIDGKKHQLPESWAEVPFKQRQTIFAFLLSFDADVAKQMALKVLLDIPTALYVSINKSDIAAMLAQMNWYSLDASAEPIQSYIEHGGKRYYFPKTDFENGTALEFMLMQELYVAFTQSTYPKSVDVLKRLAAVVVREMDKTTKKRIVLTENDDATFDREQKFKGLSIVHTTMVLRYVQGVLGSVEKVGLQFGIFDDTEKKNPETANVNLFGWKSVFRNIAESGPYKGGYDEVLQTRFWDIIEILAEREALRNAQIPALNDI